MPATAKAPGVSVIMPVYNARQTVAQAIESVIRQSYEHWELIVVDDGSDDGSEQIVQSLAERDGRIRCIALGGNSGGPAAPRNVGLDQARGSYIAFLDADDLWLPDKLERQLAFLRTRRLGVCGAGVRLINAKGERLGERVPSGPVTYSSLLACNRLILSTVLLRAEVLGGRRFEPIGHEDYLLWLELARDGVSMAVLPEVLGQYRKHAGSVSANKLKVIGYFWHIYRRRLCLPALRAFVYTARYLLYAAWRARKEWSGRLRI